MTLYNHTLLRGYLSHLHSNARELAALHFERDAHPDAAAKPYTGKAAAMQEAWDDLSKQLVIVLGPEAALKHWGELAAPGSFTRTLCSGEDPFRITFKALKFKADKARRRHPELTLLQSWDVVAREAPKCDDHGYIHS